MYPKSEFEEADSAINTGAVREALKARLSHNAVEILMEAVKIGMARIGADYQ